MKRLFKRWFKKFRKIFRETPMKNSIFTKALNTYGPTFLITERVSSSINWASLHYMKSDQIRSFFRSIFLPHSDWIWRLHSKSLYWVQMRENTDQKKLRIWTLFKPCSDKCCLFWKSLFFLEIEPSNIEGSIKMEDYLTSDCDQMPANCLYQF